MEFEWDSRKAETNERKHGVPFAFAVRVFQDEHRLERHDNSEEYGEDRWITIGLAEEFEIVVAYTMRDQVIRIISARKADRNEREEYWNR